ncbi:MAG: nucleotidyltransferase family protein, partial [bacterium]
GARGAAEAALLEDLVPRRALLPLLLQSTTRNGLAAGRGLLPHLRAATLREELRANRFRQLAADVLTLLQQAGTEPTLVRGAALAATVYPAWGLRHCHDLDLLVRPAALDVAVRALIGVGSVALAAPPRAPGSVLLRHPSALQVALHSRPFGVPYYGVSVERFSRDQQPLAVDAVRAWGLSSAANVVHVLGHASTSASRDNLRWVADVWHLLAAHPGLDWEGVIALLEAARLTLPVFVLLAYVAQLGMPVPADVLARLAAHAARAPRAAEEVALGAAHASARGRLRNLWLSTPSWRARARIARWLVAPSVDYMRSAYPVPSAWLLPLRYVHRPARSLVWKLTARPGAAAARVTAAALRPSRLPRDH